MKRRIIAAMLIGALFAGGAGAQDEDAEDERPDPFSGGYLLYAGGLFFATLDADGDYLITEAERSAGFAAAFARADRNSSGDLSPLEYADFTERALGARDAIPGLNTLDRDHDNRVSAREFSLGFNELAARYADDATGAISFSALVEDLEEVQAVIADAQRLEREREHAREHARQRDYPN